MTMDPVQRKALRQRFIRRLATHGLAILIALWVLMPIWLIATMAFSTPGDVRQYPKHFAPVPFSTDTIDFFVNSEGIIDSTLNSIWVALMTMAISTVIGAPAGYAISRFRFLGRDSARLLILSVRAFPIIIIAVPLAVIFLELGIYDNIFSLSLLHTALVLPTTVLVISSVFAGISYELEEAAQIFGCTPMQAFFQIILPLAVPGIAAAGIFAFVTSWNEVFAAILLTLSNRTLPAQILYALDKSTDPFKFAAAFFMIVPSLVFIFIIRRYLFNMWGQITK